MSGPWDEIARRADGVTVDDVRAEKRALLERVAIAAGLTDAVGCDEETVLAALNQMWLRAGELAAENERLRDVEYLRRGAKEREDAGERGP